MKSKTIMEMKHRNLILEKKIKKNIDEMKLLVKMYEMTWKTMEDDEPPEDVKRAYLIAKDWRMKRIRCGEDKQICCNFTE